MPSRSPSPWLLIAVAFAALSASGCYASHRRPIELDELREVDRTPELALCRPRFAAPIVLDEGPTFDDVSLDVVWTGTSFLVSFGDQDGVHWGARVTPDGHAMPLDDASYVHRLSVVPGTAMVAAGGSWGLWSLDPEGSVMSGPDLAGPPDHQWQWRMAPVARPGGLAVLASVWGRRVTGAPPSHEGVFAWSSTLGVSPPEHMPTDPLVAAGDVWSMEQALDARGYGRFVVASSLGTFQVVDFDDDGTPRLGPTWRDSTASLQGAVALPGGDFALVHRGAWDESQSLGWVDVRSGEVLPLAELGARASSWCAVDAMGARALVAAPFAGPDVGDDPPLRVRAYAAGSAVHDGELELDPAPGAREVELARHPCGLAAAWRPLDASVRFQAYDCCPDEP